MARRARQYRWYRLDTNDPIDDLNHYSASVVTAVFDAQRSPEDSVADVQIASGIKLTIGRAANIAVQFSEPDNQTIDLTGWVLNSQMRAGPSSTSTLYATFTLDRTDEATGRLVLQLADIDWLPAAVSGIAYIDVVRTVNAQPQSLFAEPLRVTLVEQPTV